MSDRKKSISCFVISIVGWMVLWGGIKYADLLFADTFSVIPAFRACILFVLLATFIHLFNCIIGFTLLLRRAKHKKWYLPGLLISFSFIIIFVILSVLVMVP